MNRLKELRTKMGLTQVNVQLKTGIDQSDYSKMELGKRGFTFGQAIRLALLFDTSIDYLIGMTDEKRPYPRSKKYINLDKFDIRDK